MIDIIDKVNEILPQTQCTRCGYPSCKDYAVAIANQQAEINQCPPGGDAGILQLAKLLDKTVLKLNPLNGQIASRKLAIIDENACIGCTLCIKACPVDAILGTNKMMHTVIADECTGCDLCIPVCPVDCITMVDDINQDWSLERRNKAENRYLSHQERIVRGKREREERLKQKSIAKS